ncbi:tyrosine-protein phosphatase [Sanyastnella coralliicola]|uniref:tyrosine-protein phosphatase n=1 Tax=Sanyastnella coralliicola TaxID=3069118 RepID=UPI0027BA62EC|nr:CpsB/CapC family capsule biosynthesis tyrosine phosphatase [Longitalea sp. SCSIO 12813]
MSIFTKLFRKNKVLEPIDLSPLKVDMHSHLIPGIDDGSPDMRTTLDLLRRFEKAGYKKVITTPHIMSDYYRNTSAIIRSGLERVKEHAAKAEINLELDAAAEYYLDEHFDKLIEAEDVLTFGNKNVLFELPFMAEPDMLKSTLFKLQMAGYRPILAHPERYPYWHKEPQKIRDLADRDILLQVNIGSFTGTYSPGVQKAAEWMVKENLVDFISTDCHHHGHLDLLDQARRLPSIHDVMASGKLKNSTLL